MAVATIITFILVKAGVATSDYLYTITQKSSLALRKRVLNPNELSSFSKLMGLIIFEADASLDVTRRHRSAKCRKNSKNQAPSKNAVDSIIRNYWY
jgi:hypothetical protein